MNILDSLYGFTVFLPLVFGLYLAIERFRFALVNRKILNYGLLSINFISLILYFSLTYFIFIDKYTLSIDFTLFKFFDVELLPSINLNENNAIYLLLSNILYFLINIFVLRFFKSKKQFLFTKQRYNILFSVLIFSTYFFIVSSNILQAVICWMATSAFVFVFCYLDIFKMNTKANITRMMRINFLSDFSFLIAFMLMFRYVVLFSKNFLINMYFIEPDAFFDTMIQINSSLEVKIIALALLIAVFARLIIFPFNCYYSFLASSSDIVYPVVVCINNIFGCYLCSNFCTLFEYFPKILLIIKVSAVLTIVTSFIFLFFEKNIKIIFGYIFSILNALFLLFLYANENISCIYFGCLFVLLLILMKLFSFDKNNFPKRFINKTKGFYLEKLHIFVFEKLPQKTAFIFLASFDWFFDFILNTLNKIFSFAVHIFLIKYEKQNKFSLLKTIFLIFAAIVIFLIIVILFKGADFG